MTQSAELSKRTPEEIFAHHAQALGTEDLDATELDYADSAYLITPSGVLHGKPAIRFNQINSAVLVSRPGHLHLLL
ncbi:MAG TPA: hypothetical protein DCL75_09010 [Ktedonobacter sp.]|jgi:hypothetical protein|nr:hypothetical protein [Ktedonobacter sp.]HAG98980.1 hypothetical protein [Ktedonobacter sp.]HAT44156.1 hypothetical protein [Ktedonobacter sp.]HBE29513.1 hypothetical protein [Ktedonobacter sp.]